MNDASVTIAAFDAFLAGQTDERPWRLVAGRILGTTDPSVAHEQIVSNIGVQLKLLADDQRCQAFFGAVRVQRSESRAAMDKPRPDVLLRCGPLPRGNFVTDPFVVVEVLSPSAMDVDRGDKLRFCKRRPTLRHIVFLYQDQMRGEHDRRFDVGWELETLAGPDDLLALESVRFTMVLKEAYFGVWPQ